MIRRLFLIALVLALPLAVRCDPVYLVGKVISMRSTIEGNGSVYDLDIRCQEKTYTAHVVYDSIRESEWPVERPIRFRIEGDTIYLVRRNSEEMKATLVDASGKPGKGESGAAPESETGNQARCDTLAAQGADFAPLGQACSFALSAHSLPNLVCEETTHRSVNGKHWDVMGAEVSFTDGRERWAHSTVNGKPHPPSQWVGGFVTNGLFGRELHAIFLPATGAVFQPVKSMPGASTVEYSFHIDQSHAHVFSIAQSYPDVTGTIAVSAKTGHLVRVDVAGTVADITQRLARYRSSMKYNDVELTELGPVLLPVSGFAEGCLHYSFCFRNMLAFHDCHKFGSQMRIVGSAVPQ